MKSEVREVTQKVVTLQMSEDQARLLAEISRFDETIPRAVACAYPSIKKVRTAALLGKISSALKSSGY